MPMQLHPHTVTHTYTMTTKRGQEQGYSCIHIQGNVCVFKSQSQFSINVTTTHDSLNDDILIGQGRRIKESARIRCVNEKLSNVQVIQSWSALLALLAIKQRNGNGNRT